MLTQFLLKKITMIMTIINVDDDMAIIYNDDDRVQAKNLPKVQVYPNPLFYFHLN
jgi:hypothetical protein